MNKKEAAKNDRPCSHMDAYLPSHARNCSEQKPAAPQSSPLPWEVGDSKVAPCAIWDMTNKVAPRVVAHVYQKEEADALVFNVKRAPAFDAMFDFIKPIADQECYQDPGEYPEEGEDGHAPCLSCRARAALKLAQEAR